MAAASWLCEGSAASWQPTMLRQHSATHASADTDTQPAACSINRVPENQRLALRQHIVSQQHGSEWLKQISSRAHRPHRMLRNWRPPRGQWSGNCTVPGQRGVCVQILSREMYSMVGVPENTPRKMRTGVCRTSNEQRDNAHARQSGHGALGRTGTCTKPSRNCNAVSVLRLEVGAHISL